MNDLFIRAACMDWDGVGKDSYLWNIDAIAGVDRVDFESPVTCFVGENGSGKSTLLEAMAVSYGFNPEGGTKNYSFSTFDSHSELNRHMRLIKGPKKARWGYFLRAESFYNVATAEAAYSQSGGTPQHLHEKSHGESFLATRALFPGRAGGGSVAPETADAPPGDPPLRPGRGPVHPRHPFAHPAGASGRRHPLLRRRAPSSHRL